MERKNDVSVFIEILLWAIIVFGAVWGIHSGFIKMAGKPVKFVLSIVLAFSLCSVFASSVVMPIIDQPITNYIYEFLSKNCPDINAENILDELPTVLKMAAGMSGIDIEELASQYSGVDIIFEITDKLASPVIELFSLIISFVIVYFVAKLLITILLAVLDFIFNDGLFGAMNKVLGAASGTILALAAAWAVAVIVEFLFHINSDGMENAGYLYTFFNTYSPIELLLSF